MALVLKCGVAFVTTVAAAHSSVYIASHVWPVKGSPRGVIHKTLSRVLERGAWRDAFGRRCRCDHRKRFYRAPSIGFCLTSTSSLSRVTSILGWPSCLAAFWQTSIVDRTFIISANVGAVAVVPSILLNGWVCVLFRAPNKKIVVVKSSFCHHFLSPALKVWLPPVYYWCHLWVILRGLCLSCDDSTKHNVKVKIR